MDANSFLMGGGGAPTAKFPTPGTTVGGRITAPPKVEQQRDIKTGEAKVWSNGDPMMQLVVTVDTGQRDPSTEDDDGKRRIFVKGQMKNAVADAVRSSGAKGLEVGGHLAVTYTHDGEVTQRGFSAPKQYTAQYIPAAQAALNATAPAPAAPAPPGVNTVTGEITTPPPGLTAQQYAAAQQTPATAALAQQAAAVQAPPPAAPAPQPGDEPPF
ncbi:hypothetical protein [Streptomyces sp. MNP-20]|uniref:hypothetical protein n=1 Tax=Streptomyces sp. MNP-20 TaxID=2721165 RepID=UPI001551D483|nr:hypothetical protein [Streptomyces sp. MNP-20]